MLDSSYKNKENAIEEVVYDFLKDCDLVPMSEDTTEAFLMVSRLPKNIKVPPEGRTFIFQIIEKRVEHCFTFKFTDERVLLALSLWAKNPANAITYLWYIQAWCFKNQVKEVDFDTFCYRIFPTGIFCEKDLKSVWENQKVQRKGMESDNLTDYDVAGISIQFLN